MPKAVKETKNVDASKQPLLYKTDRLLSSKVVNGYQVDFAKAVLSEEEYTIDEAKERLEQFFKRKEIK